MPNFITIPWHLLWAPLATALATSLVLTWVLATLAKNFGLDYPSHRSSHTKPIPRTGGIAIFISFIITVFIFFDIGPIKALLIGALLFALVGLIDDLWSLSPGWKLAFQIVGAILVFTQGLHIATLRNPFTESVMMLGYWWDFGLTVLWILLVVNTVNLLDGLDGLAGSMTAIACSVLAILSCLVIVNQPTTALLAMVLMGGVLGFLVFNWHPAKIFMGDTGSHLLGFLIAGLAILSGAKIATAGLVLAFPILDAVWAVIRRLGSGKMPWEADRKHFHHRLIDLGLTQPQTVLMICGISLLTGISAIVFGTSIKLIIALLAIGLMATVVKLVLGKIGN